MKDGFELMSRKKRAILIILKGKSRPLNNPPLITVNYNNTFTSFVFTS